VIRGWVDREGARLAGTLFLPPIGAFLKLNFVIDTGSSVTCLTPSALSGMTPAQLVTLGGSLQIGGSRLRSVGGQVPHGTLTAVVNFDHEDGTNSVFPVDISITTDRILSNGPSLLGRDVLFRGQVSVGVQGVFFDVAAGEHELVRT
jgi:hypothetical protein